jgi:acyl carrier protein
MEAPSSLCVLLQNSIARSCNLDPAAVTADTDVLDIGLDSVSLMSILTHVEATYDFKMTPEYLGQIMEVATVRELAQIMECAARDADRFSEV